MSLTAYPTLRLKLTLPQALKLQFLPAVPGTNAQAAADRAEQAAEDAQQAAADAINATAGKVNRSGDTMTGTFVLAGDPTVALGAATKQYVDAHAGFGADAPSDGTIYGRRNATWTAAQPLDGDLTSLAAATATNQWYYRSGPNTWSPVTVGATMTFSGGVLNTTAGGGNVIADGIPLPGQLARWTSAATIEGVEGTQGSVIYRNGTQWTTLTPGAPGQVLTTGGIGANPSWTTVSGGGASVTISDTPPASPSQGNLWWESDTGILAISYNDGNSTQWVGLNSAGGGNVSSVPTPASGQWAQWTSATTIQGVATASMPFVQKAGDTMTGGLTIETTQPLLDFKAPTGTDFALWRIYVNGKFRWQIGKDNVAESGSNAGSNFGIYRHADDETMLGAPLTISRADGSTTLTGNLIVKKFGPDVTVNKSASGEYAFFVGQTNGVNRWAVAFGDATAETGGNVGSDFQVLRWSDTNANLGCPFLISRYSGSVSIGPVTAGNIDSHVFQANMRMTSVTGGISIRNMTAGSAPWALMFNNSSGTPVGTIAVGDSSTAYNTTSDVRLKEDDRPFLRGREIIDQITIKDFAWKGTDKRDIGVIAQEVENAHPQAVSKGYTEDDFWGVDYSKYVPILIQALQDAHKRIDELEARLAVL